MSNLTAYRIPIIYLLLAAIITLCFLDTYANDILSPNYNAAEIETVEINDCLEEETSIHDSDKDDGAFLFLDLNICLVQDHCLVKKNTPLLPSFTGIFFPPPER